MAETKLSKARQPKEKRAAGPVEDKQRLEQEPAFRKRADRLRNAEINISPGILTILDSLPFYVMLIDERHHILLANKAVRDQLQVSPEEILGQYCPKAIHGLKGPFPGCPLEDSLTTGGAVERELYDERYGRWVNSAVYPTDLKTRDGKTVYYHMTYDITDRKQAEERHKESEQRFKAIFTSASDGIVLADAKSRKFYIGNKMMPRMDGYSACAALKKDPQTAHIPVVMLTGVGHQLNRVLAMQMGADDYITKPFDVTELKAITANFI
jgi:PAS domain S-box-containing protein